MSAPLGLADRIRDYSPARDGRSRYSGGGGAADDAPYDRYQAGSRGRSRSPGVDARRYSSGRRDDDRYYDAGNSRPRSRSPLRRGGAGGDVDMPDGDFRRVYVGNLSYDTKWTHLKDLMREVGEVLHADVLTQSTGRSKGCGIVEFASASDARRAIRELTETTFMGRKIFLREDREEGRPPRHNAPPPRDDYGRRGDDYGRRGGDDYDRRDQSFEERRLPPGRGELAPVTINSPQLFVMNLSYSVDWKELKDFFRSAGKIVRADIQTGSDGRSRGNGIVVFETVGDAQNAVDRFNGYEWHGRRIELREDKFAREGGRGGNGRDDRRGGGDDYRGDGDRGRRERRRSDDYDDKPSRAPRNASPRARNPFTDDAQSSETPSASIMVRNLPWATTNDDLLDLFTTTGTVERAEIAYDRTNRPAGTAVVQFASTEHAQQTIAKLDGYNYGNRPLMLTYASYGDDVAPAAGLADGEDNAMTGVDDGATPAIPNGAGDITASSIQIANVSDEPAQPIEPPVPASDGDDLDVPMPAV